MSLSLFKSVQPSPRNVRGLEKVGNCRLRHLNWHISGTGSGSHMSFELDQWPYSSFQTSLSLSKSVQPSPRNMRGLEKVGNSLLRHFNWYISGTGSGSHMPFELDQWPYNSFQTSLSLSKSVQPSLRNMRGLWFPTKKWEIVAYVT